MPSSSDKKWWDGALALANNYSGAVSIASAVYSFLQEDDRGDLSEAILRQMAEVVRQTVDQAFAREYLADVKTVKEYLKSYSGAQASNEFLLQEAITLSELLVNRLDTMGDSYIGGLMDAQVHSVNANQLWTEKNPDHSDRTAEILRGYAATLTEKHSRMLAIFETWFAIHPNGVICRCSEQGLDRRRWWNCHYVTNDSPERWGHIVKYSDIPPANRNNSLWCPDFMESLQTPEHQYSQQVAFQKAIEHKQQVIEDFAQEVGSRMEQLAQEWRAAADRS